MTVRAVVVDDEALGRRGIVSRLPRHSEVELVAECAGGREAIEVLARLRPDLVFLDVQMPVVDGFDVLAALGDDCPQVIFVTAYDRHAIRAFDVHAIGYLLKPIDDRRFDEAVRRAIDLIDQQRTSAVGRRVRAMVQEMSGRAPLPPEARPDRFAIRSKGKVTFVRHADVDWIEAAGDYVRLHAGGKGWLLRQTMSALEQSLPGGAFVRVHRSAMVNLERVVELRAIDNGDYTVVLRGGREVRLSRTYQDVVDRLTGSHRR